MSLYEQRLENDLTNLRERVATLAQQVEQAVENSLHAVATGNEKRAYLTILRDGRINNAHRQIDKACYRFIAQHLPSGSHLRLVSSAIRTALQLERIGDYAVTISREAIQLSAPPGGVVARELEMVADNARNMLHQAVVAFAQRNAGLARSTAAMASNVEHTFDTIYSDLMAEGDRTRVKDLLALFVIFNMIKRISDQSKNICEETIFAVAGESKQEKIHKILFLDEENSTFSPMAEAIAERLFPNSAYFHSAGRSPAASPDPDMVSFMTEHGFDMAAFRPAKLDTDQLGEFFVVVSLQGPVRSYVPEIPFHTSALEWDVGATRRPGEDAERRFEELYRQISMEVRDLMDTMRGEAAN